MTPTTPESARSALLRTVRRFHAWIGVAGAGFGVLMGTTGFLMNHRAVWKIDAGSAQESHVQMALAAAPPTIEALAAEVAAKLGQPTTRARMRARPARPANVAGANVTAAEEWTVTLPGHRRVARATYVPGNRSVEVDIEESDLIDTLKRMHRSEAGDKPWVLVLDGVAGFLIFQSLSGVLLWTKADGPKLVAAALLLGTLVVALIVALRAM